MPTDHRTGRLRARLNEVSSYLSESHLIRFDFRVLATLGLLVVIATAMLTFKLHASSIHMWDRILPEDDVVTDGLIVGRPKAIRSDDYVLFSPLMLSQASLGNPVVNPSIGAAKAPLFANVPVAHFTTLFRPQMWGFFIFDRERAFSWFWAFKTVGLFAAGFLLFLVLTRNNYWLSLFGALWLYLSSFVQWFFSIPFLPGLLASVLLSSLAFMYMLTSAKRLSLVLGAMVFAVFSVNSVLYFYPPFLIPLVYMSLFLVAGYWIAARKHFQQGLGLRLVVMAVGIVAPLLVLAVAYLDARSTFELMAGTANAGARVVKNGGVLLTRYFNGFFGMFLREDTYPAIYPNVCESSNFILLFPLVFVGMVRDTLRRIKVDAVEAALLLYILFVSVWLVREWNYPAFFSDATLLNRVHWRGIVGVGIASIILSVAFAGRQKRTKTFAWWGLTLSVVVFLAVIKYGLSLQQLDGYFSAWRIVLVATILAVVSYCLLHGERLLLGLVMLPLLLPNLGVNPVASGLRPMLRKDLALAAGEIAGQDRSSKWLVFGQAAVANYLKAVGTPVLNGFNLVPKFDAMAVLDPDSKNRFVYNRSAMITLTYHEPKGDPRVEFELGGGNQFNYQVSLEVCAPEIGRLGAGYMVFTSQPASAWLECAYPITRIRDTWITRFEEDGTGNRRRFLQLLGDELPELESLPVLSGTTRGGVGRVGGHPVGTAQGVLQIEAHDYLEVFGWAVDAGTRKAAGGVYVVINGEAFPARYGLRRKGIADAFKSPAYEWSGFKATIPTALLKPGLQRLSIRIVGSDARGYYAASQEVLFEVE